MATRFLSAPKEKRRNSEKRKEKSRVAARQRRGQESEILQQLAEELPLPANTCNQLDKASIMRLAIGYIKIRHLLSQMNLSEINSDEKHDKLLSKALQGFLLILTEDGEVIYLSDNVNQYLGLSQVDLLGQSIFDYTHPCDWDEIREVLDMKSHLEKDNQTTRSLFIRMKSTLTEKGKNVNMKSAAYKVINFTGRVFRSKPQENTNIQMTNTLIPTLGNCLIAIGEPIAHPSDIDVPLDKQTFLSRHNMDMSFTFVDDKIKDLLGYSSEDMLGKTLYQFHHAQDTEAVDKFYKILFSKGQCETGCYRFLAKNGGYVWVLTQATIIYGGKSKKPLCVVCVNYILSGLENTNEIVSVEQVAAKNNIVNTDNSSNKDNFTEPVTSAPLHSTNTIFAPRTKDMNKGFLTFVDDESGYTVLNDEPDDLTHLAPTAGDVCIPLDVPTFSNDMFEDVFFTDSFCDSEMMAEFPVLGEEALQTETANPLTNDPLLSYRADRLSSDTDDMPNSNLCNQNSPSELHSNDLSMSSPESDRDRSCDSRNSVDRLLFLGMKLESANMLSDKSDVDLEGDEFDLRAPYIPMGIGEDLPLLSPPEHLWASSTNSPKMQETQLMSESSNSNCSISNKSSLAKLLQSSIPVTSNSGRIPSIRNDRDLDKSVNTQNEKKLFGGTDENLKSEFDGGGRIKIAYPLSENCAQFSDGNLYRQTQKRTRALSTTKRVVNKRAKVDSTSETEDLKRKKPDDERNVFKDSVLLNLLVSGQDVSHGYSCYTGKGNIKKNIISKNDNGLPFKKLRYGDSSFTTSLITPESLAIPSLLDITQLDMEVNAPVYKSQDLLQGQELLNALDSTVVTDDNYI